MQPRFTGLGEISPREFAQFIGKEMVLAHGHRVEYARAPSLVAFGSMAACRESLRRGEEGRRFLVTSLPRSLRKRVL